MAARFLTLEKTKEHLRIDQDFTIDDSYLTAQVMPAAEIRVENRIKRKIYVDQESMDAALDTTGVIIDEVLKTVMLLFAFELYENRSSKESEQWYFNSAVKEMLAVYVNHA